MKPKITLISIMTDDVRKMVQFYKEVLGFSGEDDGEYVELDHEGVRFAICSKSLGYQLSDHESYQKKSDGQSFELAFWLPTKADVDRTYEEIVGNGATPIMEPRDMPWGQRTALFADPDGNIHEIYAN